MNIEFECKISLADCLTWLFTILGFAIAIYQFKRQMDKERENRNRENKTTWFLNVIVYPHLDMLHNFYKKLDSSISSKKDRLDQYRTGTHTHAEFIEQRASAQSEIKKEIADFFDFLTPLISSYSKQLGLNIQSIKNNLVDDITKFLEEEDGQLNLISIKIVQNKQNLLQKLHAELSVDSPC